MRFLKVRVEDSLARDLDRVAGARGVSREETLCADAVAAFAVMISGEVARAPREIHTPGESPRRGRSTRASVERYSDVWSERPVWQLPRAGVGARGQEVPLAELGATLRAVPIFSTLEV